MVVDLTLSDSSPSPQSLPHQQAATTRVRSSTMAAPSLTGRARAFLLLAIAASNIHGTAEGATATTTISNPATTTCDVIFGAGRSCPTSRSTAPILATEPARGLFYLDNVVDEASIVMLKTRFNLTMQTPLVDGRRVMDVPNGVVARLETALRRRHLDLGVSQTNGNETSLNHGHLHFQLPIQEHQGAFGKHKDH